MKENNSTSKLDQTDIAILRALQENSNLTTKEIADKVNLSTTPVFERLKRMQVEGYIEKYVAVLNAEKLGCGFQVFCQIKLIQINKESAQTFVNAVCAFEQVTECYNISGSYDYLLKICVPDMSTYRSFVMEQLGVIPNIASLQSTFVMSEEKRTFGFPII
jgi:Lrp/AsnC family leucine-responsive transcriptional regulator